MRMEVPKMAANLNPVDIKPDVRKTVNSFGSFKVALADVLTVTTVLQLATFFEYTPVIIEELGTAVSAGLLMIRYMEERGQIKPTNILTLLSALKKMCLFGTEERVKKLYEEHTGRLCSSDGQSKAQEEGKLKTFTNSLKHTYALWYNRIQPIPYIREKIFCVDDIYVESGLELVHQPSSFKHVSQSFAESGLVSLKSFRDIFDSDIIPSNRILLEGDPGYGKSTLTLQAAYDWCLGNVASPLKNVAVFILLPLRLLGNISSIFEAIRFVLMPKESLLTDDDIGEILRNSLSVIIVLDGFDEYPDKNSVIETDVINMIAGKMFPNVKVVVSTRSSSLPTCLDPATVIIRLTGFGDKSRDEYIQRTVTGGDLEASKRITNALNSSPILNDICQVPIFCVLFSHVANDQKGVIEFSSVTSFFKYVIDCFYSHMWKKDLKEPIQESIREYSKLNRLAFDGLTGKTQMIAWPKRTFIDTVGKGCYEELSNIGILIVDKTHEIINEPEEYDIHHTKQSELVRFYHKLFAEWYAARYLSSYAGSFWPLWLKPKLNKINPVDLQFVFRFACGLNKKASGRIIKYLKSVEVGASFASLCLFEQPDDPEEVVETVKGLCSDGMIIRSSDSRLLQRSNIQLLDIASRKKIEVPCLHIDHSFKVARQNEVTLESGLSLPVLLSVRKLVFTTQAEHEITKENMFGVVQYGQRCLQLKTLAFHGKFVLPLFLTEKTLKSNMNARSITVFWQLLEYVFQLDVSSGKWQLSSTESLTSGIVEPEEDLEMLKSICSGGMALRRTDSRLLQRANIQFLEIASRKKIGVPCLQLDHSFKVAQQNEVTLESGLSVPVSLSIEKLVFKTPAEHEISQENMLGVVKYGQRCLQLKTLAFHGQFVLPLSLTVEKLKSNMNSRSITVFWQLLEYVFQLDVSSGKWRLSSTESLTSGIVQPEEDLEMLKSVCSGGMALRRTDSRLLQRANIQFLEIASRNKIPLSCLVLDTFREAEQHSITLENGNHVPALSTLEEIQIRTETKIEFTQEQVIGLLCYAQTCQKLKKISFIDCLVPLCFPNDSLWPCASDKLRVLWKPGEQELDLNFTRGRWMVESQEYLTLEPKDHHSLTKMCSGTVTLNTNDTKEYHRSVIMLLQIAASQQIQITSLLLKSFSSADKNHLILESRNRVPLLPTLKELQIKTNLGKEFTQDQVIGLFCFAQQCQQLKTLSLVDCLLPLSLPIGSLSSLTKLRDIQVSWKPSTPDLHLDSSRGKWVLNSKEGITLETEGQNSLRVLCSSVVYLRQTDSKPLQMSTILLLDIASSHNIPISHLYLEWSFSGFDGEDIRLESGLSLSSLSSVEKISINEGRQNQEFTEKEVIGLINYGIKSPLFKELWLHNCKLPSSIKPDIIPEESRSRNVKVISSNEARYLDLISGTWRKPDDIQTITEMCSDALSIDRDTSESVQRSVIELLVEASNHDIPIDCVTLGLSFSKIDEDGNIILSSGLSLPIITSIENMYIQTEKGRDMNEHEVNGILNYVQHSQRFKELQLTDCLLTSSISVGPSLSTLKSRGVKVFWIPDCNKSGERYTLNLDSGLWRKVGSW
ncbi:uncharacterized protein [Apostichopus japonicus]|uniref:uncharacterized protein isoform X2 n=1 Tax=Stichopus japonicus TaxID=307972 RepID=UPI003AB474E2